MATNSFTLSKAQRERFLRYAKSCASVHQQELSSFRSQLLARDKIYQRNVDETLTQLRAEAANRAGDPTKMQNAVLPIAMPMVESAVAYQASLYLQQRPIFGVVADKDGMDAAMQFQALMESHATQFGWPIELIQVLRDGFKFNFGAAVPQWVSGTRPSVANSRDFNSLGNAQVVDSANTGNKIQRIDPYNLFLDMTVSPTHLHDKGEFFGWNEMLSRIELIRLIGSLPSVQVLGADEAYTSPTPTPSLGGDSPFHYYVPPLNKELTNPAQRSGWTPFFEGERDKQTTQYRTDYLVTHFYCRALPTDFGQSGNSPVVFHAIIVNWHTVVFVEKMFNAHDFLPCLVMMPTDDGSGYQAQSMVDTAAPYQASATSLQLAAIDAMRRQVFDRLLYNDRLVRKEDIDPANSVARIPLRGSGVTNNTDISKAVYQLPFNNTVTATAMQMGSMIAAQADEAAGQNRAQRGQFVKGNKTAQEFQTIMGGSNQRQQLATLMIEHQFMGPLKRILMTNILQFQPPVKVRNADTREMVSVDPIALRSAALEFQVTDGTLPADKLLDADLMMVFLQTAQALPALGTEYDPVALFLYWLKLRGATWVDDFKRTPDQQAQYLRTLAASSAASKYSVPPGNPAA